METVLLKHPDDKMQFESIRVDTGHSYKVRPGNLVEVAKDHAAQARSLGFKPHDPVAVAVESLKADDLARENAELKAKLAAFESAAASKADASAVDKAKTEIAKK